MITLLYTLVIQFMLILGLSTTVTEIIYSSFSLNKYLITSPQINGNVTRAPCVLFILSNGYVLNLALSFRLFLNILRYSYFDQHFALALTEKK
jgi:hypothetical protein